MKAIVLEVISMTIALGTFLVLLGLRFGYITIQ